MRYQVTGRDINPYKAEYDSEEYGIQVESGVLLIHREADGILVEAYSPHFWHAVRVVE